MLPLLLFIYLFAVTVGVHVLFLQLLHIGAVGLAAVSAVTTHVVAAAAVVTIGAGSGAVTPGGSVGSPYMIKRN